MPKPLPAVVVEACMCPACKGDGPWYLTTSEARRLGMSEIEIKAAKFLALQEGRLSIMCCLETANPRERAC